MKKRADQQLFDLGLVDSRSKARDLIKRGLVHQRGIIIKKPSEQIDALEISIDGESDYVSRGYLKLQGIHEKLEVSLKDFIVGDFGASTGGFTQYVLEQGARKVYAIDVGRDQLHPSLKKDERVIDLSPVNIRDGVDLDEELDLAVVDVSFISLELILEKICSYLKIEGKLLVLIKPQFEVGKGNLDKKGLVKSHDNVINALKGIFTVLQNLGMTIHLAQGCTVKGKTGNQEYFFYAIKHSQAGININDLEGL